MSLAISSSSSFFLDISHFAAARGPEAVRKPKAASNNAAQQGGFFLVPLETDVHCGTEMFSWKKEAGTELVHIHELFTKVAEGRHASESGARPCPACPSVLPASLRRRSGSGCSYSSEQRLRPCGLSRNPTLCHLQLAWRRSAGLAQPAGQCAIELAHLTVFGVRVCSDQGEDAHRQGDRDRHRV